MDVTIHHDWQGVHIPALESWDEETEETICLPEMESQILHHNSNVRLCLR
jgi:hypothetical protein